MLIDYGKPGPILQLVKSEPSSLSIFNYGLGVAKNIAISWTHRVGFGYGDDTSADMRIPATRSIPFLAVDSSSEIRVPVWLFTLIAESVSFSCLNSLPHLKMPEVAISLNYRDKFSRLYSKNCVLKVYLPLPKDTVMAQDAECELLVEEIYFRN